MAWKVIDRNVPVDEPDAPALLSEAVRDKIRSFFPRYETKRAAMLPALHIVQETYGHVSYQAMREVAEVLEVRPADVMDVVSFYTHFKTYPKGEKTIMVCRSLSCELQGGRQLLEALKEHLSVEVHGSSQDGKYYLMTEECLAACDHAPCMMINERMHQRVDPAAVGEILDDAGNDRLAMPRSGLFDSPEDGGASSPAEVDTTSDVKEMMGG